MVNDKDTQEEVKFVSLTLPARPVEIVHNRQVDIHEVHFQLHITGCAQVCGFQVTCLNITLGRYEKQVKSKLAAFWSRRKEIYCHSNSGLPYSPVIPAKRL